MRPLVFCAVALAGCLNEPELTNPLFPTTTGTTEIPSTGSDEEGSTTSSSGTTGGSDSTGDGEDESTTTGSSTSSSSGGDESTTGDPIAPPPCPEQQMIHFPVEAPHNIGYDHASCGTGTCEVSCPDENANSDWSAAAGHHGIDVFAHHQAPLVAVADGTVVAVGVVSETSGLRVRLRDACGWEYYYGHLDEAVVDVGDVLEAGQPLGTMGATGTASVHLHFNVSFDGDYNNDIDPIDLLVDTSPTACP